MPPTNGTGLRALDRKTCLRLLTRTPVGRIGLTADGHQLILPVNFVVATRFAGDDPVIVVHTGVGTKLEAAARNDEVAFEADSYDVAEHAGWSVVVQGKARLLLADDELQWAASLPLRPWARPGSDCYVSISIEHVHGRRFGAEQ